MSKRIVFLGIIFFSLLFSSFVFAQGKIVVYFFWGQGCPHCETEKPFLEKMEQKYPQLEVKDFEVYHSKENQELFQKVAQVYNTSPAGVPMTFIGKDYIVGFGSEQTTGKQIENLIQNCLQTYCPSPEEVLEAGGIDQWQPSPEQPPELPPEQPPSEAPEELKVCIFCKPLVVVS